MATCKGCGKTIVWGVTQDGKRIPLDPSAPIYVVHQIVGGDPVVVLLSAADRRLDGPWVSHFATCVKANEFSASKKAKA